MSVNRKQLSIPGIIPQYLCSIKVTTEQELLFIGRGNLQCLKQYWRSKERNLVKKVAAAQAEIDLTTAQHACTRELKAQLAHLVAQKNHAASTAKYLTQLMKRAEDKPYFVSCRTGFWFNVNDPVQLYVSDLAGAKLLPNKAGTFVTGAVVNGFRYHDGCVSAQADHPFYTGRHCDGRSVEYDIHRPEVLKASELDYLRRHPEYQAVWLEVAQLATANFDGARYRAALNQT